MNVLETERLALRKIEVSDAPFMLKLLNSQGWLEYIGDRKVHSVVDAEIFIEKYYIPSYTQNGYGSYLVSLKESSIAIGACGLYKREDLDNPDIGFAFLPDYIGKGYGYESAKAVLDFAFSTLQLHKILGFTVKENIASIKLLEKLGLKEIGTYDYDSKEEYLLLFST
ncbi:GNAT family N-acetyltransferase [Patiriisocius hiemis]|uniref:GNAT family N-acetyltransferase n=1 Tax=Patiriisocius hiemis TaxID=3075604 RepID=A0ABU2Y8S6_9FLAO|nr:GNAT family N-acetyltransferase [Constantimarinum sp. W242]MDT0554566.1 GNAT family N-acetyltransferase [Constantimarinum sp. W242]